MSNLHQQQNCFELVLSKLEREHAFIQAVWSASVNHSTKPLSKPLFADARSGVLFNFSGSIQMGSCLLPNGIIVLPVLKKAEAFTFKKGAQVAGIRLQPGADFSLFKERYETPMLLCPQDPHYKSFNQVFESLKAMRSNEQRVQALYSWANKTLHFDNTMPDTLYKSLRAINEYQVIAELTRGIALSNKQLERYFKHWVGMTPKHYQRILRVKKAIHQLEQNNQLNLAELAYQCGFSDQPHMTREFRAIAKTTPGRFKSFIK